MMVVMGQVKQKILVAVAVALLKQDNLDNQDLMVVLEVLEQQVV